MPRPEPRPIADRLWARVDKSGPCWVWTGARTPFGHGIIGGGPALANGTLRVHRVSWEIHFGVIPPGLHVCHHCDNPPCVRPDHLFLGTNEENQHDKIRKGRNVNPPRMHGVRNYGAKLTPEQVAEIRSAPAGYGVVTALARKFRVERHAIGRIRRGVSWKESGMDLHADQLEALSAATDPNRRISVVTGPPGCGKTTVVRAIVEYFERERKKVVCGAPTGKAARRLSEATGRPAATIHRLLEPTRTPTGGFIFARGPRSPLELDVLVLDEVSMVDVRLGSKVLGALPPHARLVLVGDVHQLPAVGPGAVLQDLLASALVPAVELRTIKRQNPGAIVTSCHAIKDGRNPAIENKPEDDLLLKRVDEPEDIALAVRELVLERLPRAYGFDKLKDIQVITPTREKGELSCLALNGIFQAALHPGEVEDSAAAGAGLFDGTTGEVLDDGADEAAAATAKKKRKRLKLLVGDKVIQTKNDYNLGICNGDVGFIRAEGKDERGRKVFEVAFDSIDGSPGERIIEIPAGENNLELAYAVTCHKAQGSEFPAVVIPIHSSFPPMLLTRNWAYTAISRAKKLCVLVGEEKAIAAAVRRVAPTKRTTALNCLLKEGAKAC